MGPGLLRSPPDLVTLPGKGLCQNGMRVATGGMFGPTKFRESESIR